jgi:DNA-directed RNA polymerase specialized sigma24 family protein
MPEIEWFGHDRALPMKRRVGQLPPNFREATVLGEVVELSCLEIAGITSVALAVAMSRQSRGQVGLELSLKSCDGGSGHDV